MRENWKYEPLGEICELLNGFAFKSSLYVNEGIRVIRIANVQKGYIEDSTPAFYPFSYEKDLSRYMLQEGDLLMSLTGNVGRVGILKKELLPAALNQRVACIRLRRTDILLKYLFHYFNSNFFEAQCISSSHGAAQLNMSTVWLAKHLVPVPPLSEQERIVALLDEEFEKIDAIKANAASQLQAAKDLFQAALKQYLAPKEGWEMRKIGDIFNSYSGGTPLKSHLEYYKNANIPWLNSGEVCRKYITETDNYISELGMKNSSAKYFPIDTVLVAMYGATAAQAGILKFKATSNQAICGLLPNEKMIPEFVYYWFIYNKNNFASMAQGGAQPNLSQVKIKAMPIPYIAKEQQKIICYNIAELENKVSRLHENYNKTLTLCNDLKQSLLKSIFD